MVVRIAKLSTFMRENRSRILSEWETFARTLAQGSSTNVAALREHAATMLDGIAADIDAPQSAVQQSDKSKGLQQEMRRSGLAAIAAAEYGHDLAGGGFTVLDVMAEFRALRASVTRLWITQSSEFGRVELDELIRFNEAVDEAIAYSLERYVRDIEETRRRFLAILSHDLRNPLAAVASAASFLEEVGKLALEQARIVGTIQHAAARMDQLVADMLELAAGLGNAMPIRRTEVNVGDIIEGVVTEIQASYPSSTIEVGSEGDLAGRWDSARLTQALTNLLTNALQHGDTREPIRVFTRGGKTDVSIEIRNTGRRIPGDRLRHLFEGPPVGASAGGDRRHLGLGLFIVNKIVQGHGGTIEVRSSDAETAFTIRLPRAPQGARVSELRASSASPGRVTA